jgi:anti-sigma regulatory factor (Ser/Thr protein kinase)
MPPDPPLLLEAPPSSAARLSLSLRSRPEAIGMARRAVTAWAWDLPGSAPSLDALQLLISEVVTDAVLRADAEGEGDASVGLRASWADGSVRVIVTESGAEDEPGLHALDERAGYRPLVVDKVAQAWGEQRADGERSVWFVL